MHDTTSNAVDLEGVNLIELTNETVHNLEAIWKDIGLAEEEQDQQRRQLVRDVIQTYRRKIADAEEDRENKKTCILSLQTEIQVTAKQIGEMTPNIPSGEGKSLLEHISTLEGLLKDLKDVKEVRISELSSVKTELYEVYSFLGEHVEPEFADVLSDLTKERILKFQQKLGEMKREKNNRVQAAETVITECAELLTELKIEADSDIDKAILNNGRGLTYSMDTIELLSGRARELTEEKTKREEMLGELGNEINELWKKLKISENVRNEFFEGVGGIGMDAIYACKEELERLRQVRKERMFDLVQDCRKEIVELWDAMEFSEESRQYFSPMDEFSKASFEELDEEQTENVLKTHEEELESLQSRFAAMKPLLKYIEKRESIIKERDDYEESLKDPERLFSRNGKRDTGRLLREEKLQNRIRKDLPKITEFLQTKIPAWQKQYDMPFLYKGEEYLERMLHEEQNYKVKKDQEKAEKERKKKQQLKHEAEWGATPSKKSMRSRKSISAVPSGRKSRISISSAAGGGANNVCLSRDGGERVETDFSRRFSSSTQSSSRSDESMQ